jgi:hypothetical protein
MDSHQRIPQVIGTDGLRIVPSAAAGEVMSRRLYAPPRVERRIMPSIVMGGPSGKVEQQPQQGHKRP